MVALSAILMAPGVFSGCASGGDSALPESPISGRSPVAGSMRGTIRDLAPAVRFAASKSELAVIAFDRPDDRTYVFELISVRDEPATLTVRVPEAPERPGDDATVNTRGSFRGFVRDFRPDLSIPGADQTFDMDATMMIGPGSARRESTNSAAAA